jgi:hypothetical protein
MSHKSHKHVYITYITMHKSKHECLKYHTQKNETISHESKHECMKYHTQKNESISHAPPKSNILAPSPL